MDLPRIEESVFDGPEPIHRTAYLNDDVVASVYGNETVDRWLIGWPLAEHTHWGDMLGVTLSQHAARNPAQPELTAVLVFGRESTQVVLDSREDHIAWRILQKTMREDDRRHPSMIIIDTDDFQVEFTLTGQKIDTVSAAVMTKAEYAERHAILFSRFHANSYVRNERAWSKSLLKAVCHNNRTEDDSFGKVHLESRNGYYSSR